MYIIYVCMYICIYLSFVLISVRWCLICVVMMSWWSMMIVRCWCSGLFSMSISIYPIVHCWRDGPWRVIRLTMTVSSGDERGPAATWRAIPFPLCNPSFPPACQAEAVTDISDRGTVQRYGGGMTAVMTIYCMTAEAVLMWWRDVDNDDIDMTMMMMIWCCWC